MGYDSTVKMLLKFYRISQYKCPTGAYPLCDFHEICKVCRYFQRVSVVKIWVNFVKGLGVIGFFKLRVSRSPKFSAPPSSETVHQTPGVLEVHERARKSLITTPSLV